MHSAASSCSPCTSAAPAAVVSCVQQQNRQHIAGAARYAHTLNPCTFRLQQPATLRSSRCAVAPSSCTAELVEASQQQAGTCIDHSDDLTSDEAQALEVLRSLGKYTPTGLSDGAASLSQVRPYNAEEVQHALDNGAVLLPNFSLHRLSNIAAALAAAGHLDGAFMTQLANEAARQLHAAPAASEHVAQLAQLRSMAFLAVAYARFGLVHTVLLQQLAVKGVQLLHRSQLRPSKRSHGRHLALLAAAFAALKIHPPQLFRAMGELLKQQRHVLHLLGPQESMLLLWAFARVQHRDPPAQLLLTQRATTQVGMFDCQGLAHAYSQCASAGLTAPPLLAALRKATRQRLPAMQPQELTALLAALAGMGQQDLLLLDEVARAVYNKLANFSAAQISSCFTACSLLRYRNPWLLDRASKMLVSRKLFKAVQLSALQLSDILAASSQLRYHNPLLLEHLGSVAAETLVPGWSAADVACVLQGYCLVGFYQPPVLQTAAARLLQLASNMQEQQQRHQQHQQQQEVQWLIAAAHSLVSLPVAGGTAAERNAGRAAVVAVAARALQQSCSCSDWVRLGTALVLAGCWGSATGPATGAAAAAGGEVLQEQQPRHQYLALETVAAQQQGSTTQQQQMDQPAEHVLQLLLQSVRGSLAAASAVQDLQACGSGELLELMQLLWLAEQRGFRQISVQQGFQQGPTGGQQPKGLQPDQQSEALLAAAVAAGQADGTASSLGQRQQQEQQQAWQLGLPEQLIAGWLQVQREEYIQQQQQQEGLVLVQAVLAAVRRQLSGAGGGVAVHSSFSIPGSPLMVPAAVVPAPLGPGPVQMGQGDQEAAAAAAAAGPSDRQQQSAASVAGPAAAAWQSVQQEQQQRQRPGVFVTAGLERVSRQRLQLPPVVLSLLHDCQASGRPAAIFVASQGPGGGLRGWFTSSAPQQLLPHADMWVQGLTNAGWFVMLLHQQVADEEGEGV